MEFRYQRNPDIFMREVAGENMLVPPFNPDFSSNKLFMLNETGAYLWNLLEKPLTMTDILDSIHRDYTVEASDSFESDINDFINILNQKGFIIIIKNEGELKDD